jgi:hypothetical protein
MHGNNHPLIRARILCGEHSTEVSRWLPNVQPNCSDLHITASNTLLAVVIGNTLYIDGGEEVMLENGVKSLRPRERTPGSFSQSKN